MDRPRDARDAAADRERLEALDAALADVAGLFDRDVVLTRAARALAHACGLDVVFVAEPLPDGEALMVRARHGDATGVLDRVVVPRGLGLGGKVLAQGHAEAVERYHESAAITHEFDWHIAREGIRRMGAAPLIGEGGIAGVVWGAYRSDGSFGSTALEGLERTGRRTGAALDAARRVEHLRETAVYAERRELSLRLHDSVGAMLFAIQAGVQDLARSLSADEALHAQAASIERHAADAAAALRASLEALNRSPEQLALSVALQADCRAFEDRTGIPAPLIALTADVPELAEARVEALVAGVREGLLNVEKHAGARTVAVTLAATPDRVTVTVADDGAGAPAGAADGSGLGLRTTTARLARLGGGARLERPDDGGAQLTLWLPVP